MQFDVHRLAKGPGLVIDCQADLLDPIQTRFVVPLAPRAESARPARRLNPVFTLGGEDYVMLTQAAATVRRSDLGPVVGSLAEHRLAILNAFDVLLTGV